MVCPQCHGETKPGAKFCSECGTKLPAVCRTARAQLTPDAKFCAECGAALLIDLHSGGTRYRYLPMVGYRDIDGPRHHFDLPRHDGPHDYRF
jgi:hypothetical protein